MTAVTAARLNVELAATGSENVAGAFASAADKIAERSGRISEGLGRVALQFSEMGKLGGRSLETLVSTVGELASAFVPGGILITGIALGITALAKLYSEAHGHLEDLEAQGAKTLADTRRAYNEESARMAADAAKQASDQAQAELGLILAKRAAAQSLPGGLGSGYLLTSLIDLKLAEAKTKTLTDQTAALYEVWRETANAQNLTANAEDKLRAIEQQRKETATKTASAMKDQAAAMQKLLDLQHAERVANAGGGNRLGNVGTGNAGVEAANAGGGGILHGATPDDVTRTNVDNYMKSLATGAKDETKSAGLDLGSTLVDGINSALDGGGLGKGFAALTGNLLSGLGRMFIQMGGPIQIFGGLMNRLKAAVTKNPLLAGAVAIAAGVALMALGHSLSSAATGGGGGSSYGGGFGGGIGEISQAAQITNITLGSGASTAAAKLTPPTPLNVTVIGENDAQAQRVIMQLFRNAQARNL